MQLSAPMTDRDFRAALSRLVCCRRPLDVRTVNLLCLATRAYRRGAGRDSSEGVRPV